MIGELYLNFDLAGVILGMVLVGGALRILYENIVLPSQSESFLIVLYGVVMISGFGLNDFTKTMTALLRWSLPLLAVQVLLAIVCIPLVYYVLLLATTRPVSALVDTAHARVGRVAAGLWLLSFVLGNAVYALLYVVY
jgi:uncharacterized membrane protein YozB (DUF420 family)